MIDLTCLSKFAEADFSHGCRMAWEGLPLQLNVSNVLCPQGWGGLPGSGLWAQ